ncbi:hypothetical protein HDV00_002203 [Rhizophlyctis rosea]|nr:hypothetical protein HDV00_002203 [Rhizophlyctis rosea]
MGAEPSKPIPLVALPHPIPAISTENRFYCYPEFITLHIKEKWASFSGDDFTIRDPNTQKVYFRVDGRALSFRQKKQLLDPEGRPVCNLKRELLSFGPASHSVYAGNTSDHELFAVHVKFSLSTNLYAKFRNLANGQMCELSCKGDWRARNCVLYLDIGCVGKQNRIPVGQVSRPITGRSLLTGTDEYYLTIAPNVDAAMMVAMCIAVDEAMRDSN